MSESGIPTTPEPTLEHRPASASAHPDVAGDASWDSFFTNILSQNTYFNAGFGLMGVGVILTGVRRAALFGIMAARRRLLVSLEIHNRDRAYEWFLKWMTHHSRAQAGSPMYRWIKSDNLSLITTSEHEINANPSISFDLTAGLGIHWLKYKGAWMQIKRERQTQTMVTEVPWETVKLTALSRDRKLFTTLMEEARDLAVQDQVGKLVVYTLWGNEWRQFGKPKPRRLLQSVVLEEGVAERIQADILKFLGRREWYADRGIPYRRGYLLHGPPGSGKSSFIQALAGSLGYHICLLNMSEKGLGDDRLRHLLSTNLPERCFVLIEDIDAAFRRRVQTSEDGYQSGVTFSGFLNALDGVASGEERILFMTTNHLDQLDPALIRPGRVDVLELIGDASPVQARRLFTLFYRTEGDVHEVGKMAETLERITREGTEKGRRVSMAALQGLFIQNEAASALEKCRDLFVKGL